MIDLVPARHIKTRATMPELIMIEQDVVAAQSYMQIIR